METPEEIRIRHAKYYAANAKDMAAYMANVARECAGSNWTKDYQDMIENIFNLIRDDINQIVECVKDVRVIELQ